MLSTIKRKRERPRQAGLMAKVSAIRCTAKELTGMPKTPRLHEPLKLWPKYRCWLRKEHCIVCGVTPCEPAHTGPGSGMARKADDRTCLPMCHKYHLTGKDSHHKLTAPGEFWRHHGLNREALWAEHNARYVAIDPKFVPLERKAA